MSKLIGALMATTMLLFGSMAHARTVTIAQSFDTETLWPNATTAAITINPGAAIVESLFWVDPKDSQLKPLLATSYEIESPTTVIVRLRPDVTFTNGEPMNADAAVQSINHVIDPKNAPAYTLFLSPFVKAEKVDDLTVRVHLKFPYAAIEQALAIIFITPPKYWNEVGPQGFGVKPVGTGPFVFDSWARDAQLVMKKNEKYWGELPAGIDELVWKPIPDDNARVSGLITGEYDIIANLPVTAVPNIEGKPDLTLVPVESYRIFFNYMSSIQEHPSPLHDVRVRRALNHAIDKKLLIDTLFMGYAVPTKGQVLRKAQIGFNPDLDDFPYDPDKARELLKEAGYPDGFELTYKVSSGAYAQDSEIPFAIAGMLEKVGVKLKVEVLEGGEYLRQLRAQELQPMGFVGMAPPNDPGIMLSIFHSNWRYPYYKNAELDKLVDEGARELDKEKRAALYRKAVQIMYDDAAVLFLYGAVDFYATNAKIKNFKPGGDGKFWLYGVSAEE